MLNMNLQFFAHKKGVGSTKNGFFQLFPDNQLFQSEQ